MVRISRKITNFIEKDDNKVTIFFISSPIRFRKTVHKSRDVKYLSGWHYLLELKDYYNNIDLFETGYH